MRIFKVFTKVLESRGYEGNLETLKIQVKLILNCPRALAITSLSHKGQFCTKNYIQGLAVV